MNIQFSKPDTYGQIHARLEMKLSLVVKTDYVNLSIDNKPEQRFKFDYKDAGTVGYARMNNQYAVSGRLTNVSKDWGDPTNSDFGLINVIGHIDNGKAVLNLWRNA